MKEIMDTSLVEGYIFFFEVLDMVGKDFSVSADWFIKRDFFCGFFIGTKIHKNFIFYASGSIGGEAVSFALENSWDVVLMFLFSRISEQHK